MTKGKYIAPLTTKVAERARATASDPWLVRKAKNAGGALKMKGLEAFVQAGSAPVGMSGLNLLFSGGDPQTFGALSAVAPMWGLWGFNGRVKPQLVNAMRPIMQKSGRAHIDAQRAATQDPWSQKSADFIETLPEESRNRTYEMVDAFVGQKTKSEDGQEGVSDLLVLSGPDYAAYKAAHNLPAGPERAMTLHNGKAIVNGEHYSVLGKEGESTYRNVLGHEVGTHVPMAVARAMTGPGSNLHTNIIKGLKKELMPGGKPRPDYQAFVDHYNREAAKSNEPPKSPEEMIEEYMGGTTGRIFESKSAADFVIPDGISESIQKVLDSNFGTMIGLDPREVGGTGYFDHKERGKATALVSDFLRQMVSPATRAEMGVDPSTMAPVPPAPAPGSVKPPGWQAPTPSGPIPATPPIVPHVPAAPGAAAPVGSAPARPLAGPEAVPVPANAQRWAVQQPAAALEGLQLAQPQPAGRAALQLSGEKPSGAPEGGGAPENAPNAPESSPSAGNQPSGGAARVQITPEPGAEPAQRRAPSVVMPPRTADDDAADQLIRASPRDQRTQAAMDIAHQAALASGNDALFQRRVDPYTGDVTFKGRIDLNRPEHRALIRQLKLTPKELSHLMAAQDAFTGQERYVDYWSASKEKTADGQPTADITGAQRRREYIDDRGKTHRELLQENKGIVFMGLEVTPNGKVVHRGLSTDKLVANIAKLIGAAKSKGIPIDFADINDPQIRVTVENILKNYDNGYTADGSQLFRDPATGEEIPAKPNSVPIAVPRGQADLINAALHFDVAQKPWQHAQKKAANEQARAEQDFDARKAEGLLEPGEKKIRKYPKQPQKQVRQKAQEAKDYAELHGRDLDPDTGDVNPYRAMLNKGGEFTYTNEKGETRRGTTDMLESVWEDLSPGMIEDMRMEPGAAPKTVRDVGLKPETRTGEFLQDPTRINWNAVRSNLMPTGGEPTTGKKGALADPETPKIAAKVGKLGDEYYVEVEGEGHVYRNTDPVEAQKVADQWNKEIAEEGKNLGAVHNLTEGSLRHALKMGGMPMPSIAGVRLDKSQFTGFGDITLIASKDLIDPKRNRKANWFNADVYSPRYPRSEIEFTPDNYQKVSDLFTRYRDEIKPAITKKDGHIGYGWEPRDLITSIYQDGFRSAGFNNLARYMWAKEHGLMEPDTVQRMTQVGSFDNYLDSVARNKSSVISEWLREKIENEGIQVEDKLRHGYTPSGSPRLIPHTLENAVKAMKARGIRGGEGGGFGVGSIRAKAARKFRALEEMGKEREKVVTEEEMETIKEDTNREFSALEGKLENLRKQGVRSDTIMDDVTALAEGGSKNIEYLRKMYGDSFDDMVAATQPFLEKLKNMPTEYFEGKMGGAVGIDSTNFAGAVVPKGTSPETIQQLKDRGIKVVEYPRNDPERRRELIDMVTRDAKANFMPTGGEPTGGKKGALREEARPMGVTPDREKITPERIRAVSDEASQMFEIAAERTKDHSHLSTIIARALIPFGRARARRGGGAGTDAPMAREFEPWKKAMADVVASLPEGASDFSNVQKTFPGGTKMDITTAVRRAHDIATRAARESAVNLGRRPDSSGVSRDYLNMLEMLETDFSSPIPHSAMEELRRMTYPPEVPETPPPAPKAALKPRTPKVTGEGSEEVAGYLPHEPGALEGGGRYGKWQTQEAMDAAKAALPEHYFSNKGDGYNSGEIELRLPDGEKIGYITWSRERNGDIHLDGSHVSERSRSGVDLRRKGYGEAIYREMARQVQKLGADKLISGITSEKAIKARRRIFDTPASRFIADRVSRNDPDHYYSDIHSEIPPDVHYMPTGGEPTEPGKKGALRGGAKGISAGALEAERKKGALRGQVRGVIDELKKKAALRDYEISPEDWPEEVRGALGETKGGKVKEERVLGKDYRIADPGDREAMPVRQVLVDGQPKLTNGDPVYITEDYKMVDSPAIKNYKGPGPEDKTHIDWKALPYDVPETQKRQIEAAIESGAVDWAAREMERQTRELIKNPEIAAGMGWYGRMRENLLRELGEEGRELFSQLLGATSAKTPVPDNFLQAVDAFEGIQQGRYKREEALYHEMVGYEKDGKLNDVLAERGHLDVLNNAAEVLEKDALEATGKKQLQLLHQAKQLRKLTGKPIWTGKGKIPKGYRTVNDSRAIWETATQMLPLKRNGQKFNANSGAVLKVIVNEWLHNRNSPKTPNFAGNMSGRTLQATIDVWAARYIRQLLYKGHTNEPWRIQPKSEGSVSNHDFALGQEIMKRAAKKLEMNPDDLQAVLWYAEKHNWDANGWTGAAGAEKVSFDEMFHLFFPEGKPRLTYEQGKAELDRMKAEEVAQKEAALAAEAAALGISVSQLKKNKAAEKKQAKQNRLDENEADYDEEE
jgi:hypothetical protein